MVLWLHATVKPGLHNVNQSARSRATVRMRLHPRTHNVPTARVHAAAVPNRGGVVVAARCRGVGAVAGEGTGGVGGCGTASASRVQ